MAKGNFEPLFNLLLREVESRSAELYTSYAPENHRNRPCSINGCINLAYAKNLCNAHYIRMRNGMNMHRPLKNRTRNALCSKCSNPILGKGGWGLCQAHYRAERKSIIKKLCVSYLGGKCLDCKTEYHHSVYDFHHIDPSHKESSISLLFQNGSISDIAKEVSKCELLCANCHRIRHHG